MQAHASPSPSPWPSSALVLNAARGAVGALGVVARSSAPRAFWPLLRAAQAAAVALAVVAGVAAALRPRPDDGLFWLYALLPVAVGFVAEQLRARRAQTVLDARGLEDAQAVGRCPEAEQRSVVRAIVRRELGVMAIAAAVVVLPGAAGARRRRRGL